MDLLPGVEGTNLSAISAERLEASDAAAVIRWPARVVVDATCLAASRSGIGHYTANNLAALMQALPDTGFHLFLGYGWAEAIPGIEERVVKDTLYREAKRLARKIPPLGALARGLRRARFTVQARRLRPDIIYAPNYIPPGGFDHIAPIVPVVHDLSHIRMPEAHPPDRVKHLRRLDRIAVRAPCIVTVSQFSRSEIIDVFQVPPEKIVVASPGVAPEFGDPTATDTALVTRKFHLKAGQYFLAIGNMEPRKNLRMLITAFAQLPAALRERHPMVIGGGAGWGDAGLTTETAERLRRAGHLRLLGYVPSGDLPGLYAAAGAFCFPSLYEGFGMPVIEAMACGTPVLASATGAIPEAAGDAALLLSPRDVDAWTAAMRRVVEDQAFVGTLRARGLAHAAGFTWENCARQTLKAFAMVQPAGLE